MRGGKKEIVMVLIRQAKYAAEHNEFRSIQRITKDLPCHR